MGWRNNHDFKVNFMLLSEKAGSEVPSGNSGTYNINDLDNRGSTTAAHEFSHILNYINFNQVSPDINPNADNEYHADNESEKLSIMGRPLRAADGDLSKRRVTTTDQKRINGGNGGNFDKVKTTGTGSGPTYNIGEVPNNKINEVD